MSNDKPTLAETLANRLIRIAKRSPNCNAETRICKAWHLNDFWLDIATEALNTGRANDLVKQLRDDTEGHQPPIGGIYGDLLTVALKNINYNTVAAYLLTEAKRERFEGGVK